MFKRLLRSYQFFDGFEEDNDDSDVVWRAVVFGESGELLADQVKIIWKRWNN